MSRQLFRRVTLLGLALAFCVMLSLSDGTHSQGSGRGGARTREAVAHAPAGSPLFVSAAPETFKAVRNNADVSDEMTRDLSAVSPELPRAAEDPHLAEPPQLIDINPVHGAAPAAAGAAPNPHFEQSTQGPELQTERGPKFPGISHKETVVPGVPSPNNKFIVRMAPPDTVGAVGEDHYVQWVNTSFAVFRKSTGELLYGPAQGKTLWKDFDNGPCEKANDGDPIVQYDKIHKRWIMAQFAITKKPDGPDAELTLPIPPYYQCIAVSTTSNPLGKYRRFRFQYSLFNDYPKVGVWSDGYYVTFNMFNDPNSGAMACAYDQDVLLGLAPLAGVPPRKASQLCVQLDKRYRSLLPADIDGNNSPPKGAPAYLANLDPDNGAVNLWRFNVDWDNDANSQLTGPFPVAGVETYGVPCLSATRLACITQKGTNQKLESLADRLMYRLAYRRFADGHESLLLNHTVSQETNSGTVATIRWYEVRDPGGTPTVYQSGTFAPDGNNRWMGSVAMDRLGNIGLAYSVSGNAQTPSIYYTGHPMSDGQKGRLGKEVEVVKGGGSQTCILPNGQCDAACKRRDGTCITNIARWGDYSSLTLDPSDDCTMWYTTEYLKNTGGFNWSTLVYSFRFKGCTSAVASK